MHEDGAVFRSAADDDLLPLTELERDANLAGLDHVFPAEEFPFPFEDVLARWRLVLDDPTTSVLVLVAPGSTGLAAFVAYDDRTLRHLAVHPAHWGEGIARTAVDLALRGMAAHGSREASLWALVENHRARRLYAHLGWRDTGEAREAPWPPHPLETRWVRVLR